jgi:hypothetical protein
MPVKTTFPLNSPLFPYFSYNSLSFPHFPHRFQQCAVVIFQSHLQSSNIIYQSSALQCLGVNVKRQFSINGHIVKSEPLSETYDIVWENLWVSKQRRDHVSIAATVLFCAVYFAVYLVSDNIEDS